MQSEQSHNNLSVMVVDDDDFQCEFTIDLLKDMGIGNVVSASGGMDALAQFSQMEKKHDLIICDLHMPGMDGFDLIFKLTEQNFTGAVIIASGQDQTVVDYAAIVAKISPFNYLGELEKPIDKTRLKALIDQLK